MFFIYFFFFKTVFENLCPFSKISTFFLNSLSVYSQTGVQSIEQHTSNLDHLKPRSKGLFPAENLQNCVEKTAIFEKVDRKFSKV